MFFCPNCNNIYSITKTPPSLHHHKTDQQGGKYGDQQSAGKCNDQQSAGKYSDSDTPTSLSESESSTTVNDIVSEIITNGSYDGEVDMKLIDDVLKMASYKKLSSKDKVFVKNKLMEQLPQEEKIKLMDKSASSTGTKQTGNAYFICKNCGTFEPIKTGTLVMSKLSAEGNHDFMDNMSYKNMVHIRTLPLTRNYICPNDKCVSHKDHEKREAVFFRMGSQYRVRYVCKACQISWI